MREHSGDDPASTNTQDPTLKDNEGRGGPGERDAAVANAADTIGQAGEPGAQRSPSDRGRGETADAENSAPIDISQA